VSSSQGDRLLADSVQVLLSHRFSAELRPGSVSLVPFSNSSRSSGEIVDNVLVFIPFGLKLDLWRKLLVVLVFSLTMEPFIFAIGSVGRLGGAAHW
jgi:glycopeptide antibiotics resistance protein